MLRFKKTNCKFQTKIRIMKVEHLTLLGNSSFRDTNDILPETVNHFKVLQIKDKVIDNIEISGLPFSIKATARDGMALFDIMKKGQPAFLNVCCFEKQDIEPALLYLKSVCQKIPFLPDTYRIPTLSQFLYTVPIIPTILKPTELVMAGEVEFYIWNALYIGSK